MRYMFELSGEHPDLPVWEVEEILSSNGKSERLEKDNNLAVFSSDLLNSKILRRFALSHYISEHIETSDVEKLDSFFTKLSIDRSETVAVRVKVAESKRKVINPMTLTKMVGAILADKCKVDLESPHKKFRIYIGEHAHIGSQLAEIDRSQYEKRKNRNLPFMSPVSIHPRLARALINITMNKPEGSLLDPFCGTGTILIESALAGFDTYGSDISDKMIEGSQTNLNQLNLHAKLKKLDVGNLSEFGYKFDCIVTDPPYGRSSTTLREPVSELYNRALISFHSNLMDNGRVGIIVPNKEEPEFHDLFKLIRKTSIRVHRSLTRNFLILEKTT